MKTPEEWLNGFHKRIGPEIHGRFAPVDLEDIAQIQLDAKAEGWREGMTEAAEIALSNALGCLECCNLVAKAILEARDVKGKATK